MRISMFGTCLLAGAFLPIATSSSLVSDAQQAPTNLSATSLSFGSREIGTTSASQQVTLTNTGTSTLAITSIGVTGADASSFMFANSCGSGLAVGANCVIHGHFTPAAAGALTAAVTIVDSASNSPQSIALSGIGAASATTPAARPAGAARQRMLSVDDFQASGSRSKLDVAIAAALQVILEDKTPVELHLGIDTYDTCSGIQMPKTATRALSIVGAGKGEFGKATVLRATCPVNAVITFPNLPSGQYWSNLELSHFTIDGNGMANSCMDLGALRVSRLEDISCTKAIGQDHWVQIGNLDQVKGEYGSGFQVMVNDLFVFNNATSSLQWARVQPEVTNGSFDKVEILDGGKYRQTGTVPVILMGYGAGKDPCAQMPKNMMAHLDRDPNSKDGFNKVVSVTQDSPASGCVGPIYAQIPDIPAAKYGIKLAVTDSTFYDLTVDSAGRSAAIANLIGGDNLFIHAHAWQTPVLFESAGNDSWEAPECDNPIHYCFAFRGKGAQVVGPSFYWSQNKSQLVAGSGAYYSDSQASRTQIVQENCGPILQDSGGYQRFVSTSGPLSIGAPEFNSKFIVLSGNDCVTAAQIPHAVTVGSERVESAMSGLLLNGELHNFSISTHDASSAFSFLLASLPTGTSADDTDSAVTVRFMGGQSFKPRLHEDFVFENGRNGFSYSWKYFGNASVLKNAGIAAYLQTDGSIHIYEFVGPDHGVGSVSVEEPQGHGTRVYANPESGAASGREVFSSSNPQSYPVQ
jgi:hypothetical protein